MKRTLLTVFTLGLVLGFGGPAAAQAVDSLPSWNDGKSKQSIIEFVEKVTENGSSDFVPPAERIAVFDNDGTLWAEQPIYFQLLFTIDRVKALAPQHPEWNTQEPFAFYTTSIDKGDRPAVGVPDEHIVAKLGGFDDLWQHIQTLFMHVVQRSW